MASHVAGSGSGPPRAFDGAYRATSPQVIVGGASQNGTQIAPKLAPNCDTRLISWHAGEVTPISPTGRLICPHKCRVDLSKSLHS